MRKSTGGRERRILRGVEAWRAAPRRRVRGGAWFVGCGRRFGSVVRGFCGGVRGALGAVAFLQFLFLNKRCLE